MITIDDKGNVHGLTVVKSWTTKADDTVDKDDKWSIDNVIIDMEGIHILNLAKHAVKQLVIERQKQERLSNDRVFVESFSGTRIHHSVMGHKLTSPEQSFNDAKDHANTLTDDAKRKLAQELLDSLN